MLRTVIALAAAMVIAMTVSAQPAIAPMKGDFALGPNGATVVIDAYLSPTCPACRQWHEGIFKELRTRFIDTGHVRFVLKETPSHNKVVDAAVFAIGRCAGSGSYLRVIEAAFRRQQEIARATASNEGPRPALEALAREAGLRPDAFERCVDSPEAAAHLKATREAATRIGVTSTPTLAVNGRLLTYAEASSRDLFLGLVAGALGEAPAPT